MSEYGFKFNVGDMVTIKAAMAVTYDHWKQSWRMINMPAHGIITECLLQKCSGGNQRSYTVRFTASGDNFTTPQRMEEHELVLFDVDEWIKQQREFTARREQEFRTRADNTTNVEGTAN